MKILRLALLAAIALPLRAQEASFDSLPGIAGVRRASFGLARLDGELWALGPDYRARFGPGGVEFVPALGSRAPRTYPLAFELASVRRGAEVVLDCVPGDLSALPFERQGDRAFRDRGSGITEIYEAKPEGLEQSFLFERPLGSAGELAVRIRIDTELPLPAPGEWPDGLRFVLPGLGGASIGAATGLDAAGAEVRARMRLDGAHLELVLPVEFVERAAWPIALDPLIGAVLDVDASASDDERPDVAYDATDDRYLVVWQRYFAAGDIDIRGQRLESDGDLEGAALLIESGGVNQRPAVGNVNDTDRCVVAWQKSAAAGGATDIVGRAVETDDGDVSAAVTIAGGVASQITPDVGGESLEPNDDALVVWEEVGAGIKGQLVEPDSLGVGAPDLVGAAIAISTSADDHNPAVSKHGGDAGRWLVAWERFFADPAPGDNDLRARVVNRTGALCTPVSTVLTSIGPDEHLPDCAGAGTDFLIVWERDFDIRCATATFSGACGGGSLAAGADTLLIGGDASHRAPAVDQCSGREYVVAYLELVGPLDDDVYAVGVDPVTCTVCEPVELVVGTELNEATPAIVAQRSGSASAGPEALIAWMAEDADAVGFEADIQAARYHCQPGVVLPAGPPCGNFGGHASVTCAGIGASGFAHRLTTAAPLSVAVLVVGFAPIGVACGPCVFVPALDNIFPMVTSASGSASKTTAIPDDVALVGLALFDQWAVFVPFPGCALFGVDFSNAIETLVGL